MNLKNHTIENSVHPQLAPPGTTDLRGVIGVAPFRAKLMRIAVSQMHSGDCLQLGGGRWSNASIIPHEILGYAEQEEGEARCQRADVENEEVLEAFHSRVGDWDEG